MTNEKQKIGVISLLTCIFQATNQMNLAVLGVEDMEYVNKSLDKALSAVGEEQYEQTTVDMLTLTAQELFVKLKQLDAGEKRVN